MMNQNKAVVVSAIGIFLAMTSCSSTEMTGSAARKQKTDDVIPERTGVEIENPIEEIKDPEVTPAPTINSGGGGAVTSCGEYVIPPAEFDDLDGSANAWIRGGNHAYIDWSRCPKQVTKATVDNGGIRINFKNPPASGKLQLTVNTTHAKNYRVGYATNIKGSLPSSYTHNRTYVYECDYVAPNYNCIVK